MWCCSGVIYCTGPNRVEVLRGALTMRGGLMATDCAFFYEIDTALKQFRVSQSNVARHCQSVRSALQGRPTTPLA
jgi:hypothetical protein